MNGKIQKIEINTPDPGYEHFPVSIMNRSTYEAITFDPSKGKPAKISYKINKFGCIRIRIVLKQNPNLLIRTLQDWTDQNFGKYELEWDGCDASRNIVNNKRMFVLFEANDQGKGLHHQDHDENICRDLLLDIHTEKKSESKVKGLFEIKTKLREEINSFIDKTGSEVRYYVDYELFHTERFEKQIKEYLFKLDTAPLKNGEHLITVNVNDFNDHIGSGGIKICVEN